MRGAFSAAGSAAAGTADETGRAGVTGAAGTAGTAGTAAGARACAGFAENRLGSARTGARSTGASDDKGGGAICGCCMKGAGVDGAGTGTGIGAVAGPWSCGVSLDFFLKKLNIDTLAGRDGSAGRLVGGPVWRMRCRTCIAIGPDACRRRHRAAGIHGYNRRHSNRAPSGIFLLDRSFAAQQSVMASDCRRRIIATI